MEIKSEMAGTVIALNFGPGDMVSLGDELLVLESMKMEMPFMAPVAGTVASVSVGDGDVVEAGQILMIIG